MASIIHTNQLFSPHSANANSKSESIEVDRMLKPFYRGVSRADFRINMADELLSSVRFCLTSKNRVLYGKLVSRQSNRVN